MLNRSRGVISAVSEKIAASIIRKWTNPEIMPDLAPVRI